MKYRLTFKKIGELCFLGHLDLQTLFQRAIKRAGLPVSYSKGFNPHQLISFAMPLPIGMEGMKEYVDIELDYQMNPTHIVSALNPAMPEGIFIIDAVSLPQGTKSSAALLERAEYDIILPRSKALDDSLSTIIENISVNMNIEIKFVSDDKNVTLSTVLPAGSAKNIKPSVISDYICDFIGDNYDISDVIYIRKCLFLKSSVGNADGQNHNRL